VTSDGNAWHGRLETVEQKIDILTVSVDVRFDEVTAALAEQRQYTEFAFRQLSARMDGFDVRLEGIGRKLDQFIDVQSREPTSWSNGGSGRSSGRAGNGNCDVLCRRSVSHLARQRAQAQA
jgi:hypothetical protein